MHKTILTHLFFSLLLFHFSSCNNEKLNNELVQTQNKLIEDLYLMELQELKLNSLINPQKFENAYNKAQYFNQKIEKLDTLMSNNTAITENLKSTIDSLFSELSNTHFFELSSKTILDYGSNLNEKLEVGSKLDENSRYLVNIYLKSILTKITQNLREDCTRKEISFNRLNVEIIEPKKDIKRGDFYTAQIVLNALDTTLLPNIQLNNTQFKSYYSTDRGMIIQLNAERVGTCQWNGIFNLPLGDGTTIRFPIESSFNVH